MTYKHELNISCNNKGIDGQEPVIISDRYRFNARHWMLSHVLDKASHKRDILQMRGSPTRHLLLDWTTTSSGIWGCCLNCCQGRFGSIRACANEARQVSTHLLQSLSRPDEVLLGLLLGPRCLQCNCLEGNIDNPKSQRRFPVLWKNTKNINAVGESIYIPGQLINIVKRVAPLLKTRRLWLTSGERPEQQPTSPHCVFRLTLPLHSAPDQHVQDKRLITI